jgi:hypothetical protein
MIKCIECDKEFLSNRGLSNHLRGGCSSNRKHEKNCPNCDILIVYDSPGRLKKSIDDNSKCPKCCNLGRVVSGIVREKISNTLKSKYDSGELVPNMSGAHSDESRNKMSETKTGTNLTEETKAKIKISIINSESHKIAMKNIIRNKLKGRKLKESHKRKLKESHGDVNGERNPFYGKIHNIETKRKLRVKALERIKLLMVDGKNIMPFFNKKGCDYFNKLMLMSNTNIQHALNGGEFHIKELGYFLDGYDIENNIAYEWDEDHHFKSNGDLIDNDVLRQSEIVSYLGCKFIRIKQQDYIE